MPRHIYPLNNNSKKSSSMAHHLMSHHISSLKNISKNSRKVYYSSLRIINVNSLNMQACQIT
jgi:hypothetical protein